MKLTYSHKKIIKLCLIIVLMLLYYYTNMNTSIFNPLSVFLMFPMGFIFAFQIRNKTLQTIDIIIFILISYFILSCIMPPFDLLGIFKKYILPTSNILSLMM